MIKIEFNNEGKLVKISGKCKAKDFKKDMEVFKNGLSTTRIN